jgi:hypothetical protein
MVPPLITIRDGFFHALASIQTILFTETYKKYRPIHCTTERLVLHVSGLYDGASVYIIFHHGFPARTSDNPALLCLNFNSAVERNVQL